MAAVDVAVSVDTDYPFRDVVRLAVTPSRRLRFPLLLRVPTWADAATVRVGSGSEEPMTPGALHRLEREWNGATDVTLRFPMRPVVSVRYNESVALERGPLVYSLQIGEEWSRVNGDKPHRELPHADFEVRPTTPWNYGLIVDERHPEEVVRFEERPIGGFRQREAAWWRGRADDGFRTGRSRVDGRVRSRRPTQRGPIPAVE